ncbi:hypothetical protein [Methanoculleus oceani]|uniref:Uncharacterized protein n=1 Tax=Methanoculleus oceani TaxID=2184756 RepID=A0ABD4TGB7_9EURY|nr:hypothetical protein [Methanoculleus sp. CWC-02]MCM2466913.1 hypothetical protein [Methanoculleus sp. CWC-02]
MVGANKVSPGQTRRFSAFFHHEIIALFYSIILYAHMYSSAPLKLGEKGMAPEQLSSSLQLWSIHLAENAIPDESDFAPLLVSAFIAGGKQREALFKTDNAPEGSFVPGGMVFLLPHVLAGIFAAVPYILNLLGSTASINNTLTTVCNILSLHDRTKEVLVEPELQQGADRVQEPIYSLRQVVSIIDEQLKDIPLPEEERGCIAYRIIRALLEQPDGTMEAIGRLKEST